MYAVQVSYHPFGRVFLEFGESPTGKLVSKQGRRGNIRQLLIMTEEESKRRGGGGALGVEKLLDVFLSPTLEKNKGKENTEKRAEEQIWETRNS